MNLPIESIFKQINSDMNFPLIKFNPSIKKENIYRLYSNKLSTKGQKIPYLNKAMIFKLIKGIGRESSISFYTESELKNEKIPIILEIYKNAFISVYNFSDMTNYYNINEYGYWQQGNYILTRKDSNQQIFTKYKIDEIALQHKLTNCLTEYCLPVAIT